MAWAAATSSAFSLNTRLFLSSVCTSPGRPRFNGEAYSVFAAAAAAGGPSLPTLVTPRQRLSPRRSFATSMASATVASPPSSNATASSSSSSTAASHGLALPSNLPVPTDDGGAIHLVGHPLPACAPLQVVHPTSPPSTEEPEEDTPGQVDLFMRSITRPERDILVFVYPHTGKPNAPPGNGWDDVPGARGCTPELVAVQEGWAALQRVKGKGREVQVYAMSGDEGEWQGEVSERLKLSFPLLSCHPPSSHPFSTGLSLPTFEHQGSTYLKRVTLLIREGQVVRADYPVFPPDEAWSRVEKQGWFKEDEA